MAQPTKRPRAKRQKRIQPLGRTVSGLTKEAFGRRGFADGAVVRDWAHIVGSLLAAVSHPERIAYARREGTPGTLHLRIGDSATAMEIQHLAPLLLERVNSYFGFQAVSELRLLQAPLPAPAARRRGGPAELSATEEKTLEDELTGIDDPDLKAALERLGRAVMGRAKAGGPPESDAD